MVQKEEGSATHVVEKRQVTDNSEWFETICGKKIPLFYEDENGDTQMAETWKNTEFDNPALHCDECKAILLDAGITLKGLTVLSLDKEATP